MAMTSDAGRSAGSIPELRRKWGWFVALGVLMLFAGVIAVLEPVPGDRRVTVLYVGALMLVSGIFEIVHAFGVEGMGPVCLVAAAVGILYAAAGIVAFMNRRFWRRRC